MGPVVANHAARPDRGDGQGRRRGEACVRGDDGDAEDRRREDRSSGAREGCLRSSLLFLFLIVVATGTAASLKPRIIVLTDISPVAVEPDDMESTIRLLAHADLFEIEGLVASTGWSNAGGHERPDLIEDVIAAYEKDLPNLRKRSRQDGHLADESQIG